MATINKQIEKWMTRASFDALDKSTIPEGTEINIVGDIVESDLSVDLQNKINKPSGGKLHLYRVAVKLNQTVNGIEFSTLYVNIYTDAEITFENFTNYFNFGDYDDYTTGYSFSGFNLSGWYFGQLYLATIAGTSLSDLKATVAGYGVFMPYTDSNNEHLVTGAISKNNVSIQFQKVF